VKQRSQYVVLALCGILALAGVLAQWQCSHCESARTVWSARAV